MVVGDGEMVFANDRDQASEGASICAAARRAANSRFSARASARSSPQAGVLLPSRPVINERHAWARSLAASAAGDEGLRASSAASWISSRLISTNACICSGAIGHGACRRSHHRRSRFSTFSLPEIVDVTREDRCPRHGSGRNPSPSSAALAAVRVQAATSPATSLPLDHLWHGNRRPACQVLEPAFPSLQDPARDLLSRNEKSWERRSFPRPTQARPPTLLASGPWQAGPRASGGQTCELGREGQAWAITNREQSPSLPLPMLHRICQNGK